MARGINKVILVGNVGNPPELRYSQAGNAVATLSLATTEVWKDKDGEMQERTEWHRVAAFGRLAEIVGEYVTKGRQLYVEGRLRYRKVDGKDGEPDRYFTDVVADTIQLLGSGNGGEGEERGQPRSERPARGAGGGRQQANRGGQQYGERPPPPSHSNDPFPDDDIPF